MQRFVLGMLLGTFLGLTASAYAAGIFGSGNSCGLDGDEGRRGSRSEPSVDTNSKEIECD